ncbi:MAG TPA: dihydroxyacetone kinase subunit DhaL [Terracidiphilus sp.]|jgi:dihydroxyacetone kinase-like protein|nr:dihydroxyacetone kinase subunit DhaL [Terracidiphilus sp.]
MKRTAISPIELREILRFVSESIKNEESRLNALDAAIGDGDHGITVRVGFQAVRESIDSTPSNAEISTILGIAGKSFMNATGGAIGIILGRMLMCGQKALTGRETLGGDELKCWLDAMESVIGTVGKAKPGDKTILDAVHAANLALSTSVLQKNDIIEVFLAVSQATERGASDTANMLCKVGRASRLGEKVLGHPDPGAVTFSIVMSSFYKWLINHPIGNLTQAVHARA